jgi:hypothetical protein
LEGANAAAEEMRAAERMVNFMVSGVFEVNYGSERLEKALDVTKPFIHLPV